MEQRAFPPGHAHLVATAQHITGKLARHEDIVAWGEHQPCLTRCANCSWTFEGTFADGRAAHTAHRAKHGLPDKHRRRFRPRRTWVASHGTLEANVAGARAEGAAAWVDDEEAA